MSKTNSRKVRKNCRECGRLSLVDKNMDCNDCQIRSIPFPNDFCSVCKVVVKEDEDTIQCENCPGWWHCQSCKQFLKQSGNRIDALQKENKSLIEENQQLKISIKDLEKKIKNDINKDYKDIFDRIESRLCAVENKSNTDNSGVNNSDVSNRNMVSNQNLKLQYELDYLKQANLSCCLRISGIKESQNENLLDSLNNNFCRFIGRNHSSILNFTNVILHEPYLENAHLWSHVIQYTTLQQKLSPSEANEILKNNEYSLSFGQVSETTWNDVQQKPSFHAISYIDSNQLPSNTPIEDKLASAKCLLTTGMLFGVFDGHGGAECSQVISKRLFDYIAASLLPKSTLREIVSELEIGKKVQLVEVFNDKSEFLPDLQSIYDQSFLNWCKILINLSGSDFSMGDVLIDSFLQLDKDISNEVLNNLDSHLASTLVSVAMSGSVSCVAHIDGPHLHIANTGDCGAVLGSLLDENSSKWVSNKLTKDHNFDNTTETKRIYSEHPIDEKNSVIKGQRLLGMLLPFRAFGDVRFKWSKELQLKVLPPKIDTSYLNDCKTPPYLTAEPEIFYHRLQPHEKFLILGSDGLWESIEAADIVNLIGEYLSGRQTLQPVHFPEHAITLGQVSRFLKRRKAGLALKPSDTNAATHLIRYCLGGTDEGLDHLRVSHSLTLPPDVRRYFRDDISIHVIFFDSNFLKICPIRS